MPTDDEDDRGRSEQQAPDETLLLDTSAALALVDPTSSHNAAVTRAVRDRRRGLAGHALFETLSVLTRLPPPDRVSGAEALRLVKTNFPDSRLLESSQTGQLVTSGWPRTPSAVQSGTGWSPPLPVPTTLRW